MSARRIVERVQPASAAGFGVVEVMVAALVMVIGGLGALAMVDASARNTYRAEQSQVTNDILQREMEKVRQLVYGKIALTATPATSTDPLNPNYRVSSTKFGLNANGSDLADMVIDSTGSVAPGPTPYTTGDVNEQIYRYVTWHNASGCPESLCPGAQDFKRVTIIAWPSSTAAGGVRSYQEIQADFTDPSLAAPTTGTLPSSSATPIVYSLSDSACDTTTRAVIPTGTNLVNNTLGGSTTAICAAGVKTGTTPGPPDKLYRNATPAGFTVSADLATDVEPTVSPANDRGLQIRTSSNCSYTPTVTNPQEYVHRWITTKVPTGGDLVVDSANLSLQTKTLNTAVHTGKLCIYLFVRTLNSKGAEVDNLILDKANAYREYFADSRTGDWPAATSSTWEPVTATMSFDPVQLAPGDRLGLAIAVNGTGTPATMLQFMYHNTSFDSRLTVNTTTPTQAPN